MTPAPPLPCRVIFDPPAEGAWNMAVDEALLSGGAAVLRLYQWRRPTLSLGYFQSHRELAGADRWRGLAWVRRLTGGGAVLHHRELTYALVVPHGLPISARPEPLYDAVHRAIARSLAQLGVEAGVRHDTVAGGLNEPGGGRPPAAPPAFLCFARTDPHDLVVGGRKIGGSAQRRRRAAVLQHGSIVLQTSEHAPDLPGLDQLGGPCLTPDDLARHLAQTIPPALGLHPVPSLLLPAERTIAEELAQTKYGLPWWNEGPERPPPPARSNRA